MGTTGFWRSLLEPSHAAHVSDWAGYAHLTMRFTSSSRFAGATVAALLTACGARTSLPGDDALDAEGSGGAGGVGGIAVTSSGTGGAGDCDVNDPSTWHVEHLRDFGDYERAAVATSGVPWVALKVRDGNVVVAHLDIEDDAGLVVVESFEVPSSPVYPVALDVSDTRIVMLTTTGINWNGDIELWSIDRPSGSILRTPIGSPPADPAYTVGSALALLGDDVVVGHSRLIDDVGVLEIRDSQLEVVDARTVGSVAFQAVRALDGVDVYVGADSRLHYDGRTVTEQSVDPAWHILGGLEEYVVQYGEQIRVVHGDQTWSGPWPHTQISPPAVLRKGGGRTAFTLETELTAVLGYLGDAGLEWMAIEPTRGASGLGVGLMPVLQDGRMGFFYLGLEIPMPEQPLRYYGRACR